MSLLTCINRAVRAGLMDSHRADFARDLFNENMEQYKLSLGGEEALAKAREDVIKEVEYAMIKLRREKLLQISRAKGIIEQMQESGAEIDIAAMAVLSFDPGVKGITSIESRHKAIRGALHSDMDQFLEKFRRNLVGENRNKAELVEVGRELFRQQSGNKSARELAEAWSDTAEKARRMFNQAGGDIPKRSRWGIPQSHNSIAIRVAGFDDWFKGIREGVDLNRMYDYRTGKPMSEMSFKDAAKEAFDEITTEGWAHREASGAAYGKKLSNRRLDHRFFEFKDFDAWSKYHEKYGEGDVFSVMMGHLDSMARDISALQVLGPNPTSMIRWLGNVVEKDLQTQAAVTRSRTSKFESRINSTKRNLDLLWEHHTGGSSSPVNVRTARTFAGVRSLLMAAQLGSAALSAVTDMAFQKMATKNVGISYSKVIKRYGSMLNPMDLEDQKIAVRIGLIAENWSTLAVAQQRYLGEVSGPEITRRITDSVLRVSGLSPWTQAGRWAFGMEFTGLLADNSAKKFKGLAKPLRETMTRYGITEGDWEIARKTPMLEHKGSRFMRPEDIAEQNISLKILDMIHGETEFAVPSTSARGRIALMGGTNPGTIAGELIRTAAMYKNFAVTLLFTHFSRAMSLPDPLERGKYIAQFFLIATAMGGLSLQMKDVSKGRDPRKMFDLEYPGAMAKFWGAAALQGGGLGIFGDFLFAEKNRFDGGLAQTVAGPVISAAADATGYLNQNIKAAIAGKKTNFGAGALDLAQRYMPGQSIWWARAGMENLIWEQLRDIADPNAKARIKRLERRLKRDYGQDNWWKKGEPLPSRAPNLAAAFGE